MNKRGRNLGFFGKITRYFLQNKQLSFLLVLALFAFGVLSFVIIPKQYNPKIVAPAFNIVTEFPGANSREVYEYITRPMEIKIEEISGVEKIRSRSLEGGVSIVTVQFYVGEDLDDAKISILQKIQGNLDLKPLGASNPLIKSIDSDNVPIVVIGFSSNEFSKESLRKLAFDVKNELKHVDNTATIDVVGGKKKELKVNLDLAKLEGYSISPMQIVSVIEKNNTNGVAGEIEREKSNFSVNFQGAATNVVEFGSIIIQKRDNGDVFLRDVADISYENEIDNNFLDLFKEEESKPVVLLTVSKAENSNVTLVSREVIDKLEQSKRGIPKEVEIDVLRNNGNIASEAIRILTTNLFISIFIVSIVLWVFLGWRSALIVSVSIPLTLSAVFVIGLLTDKTINRITLFALILSLGLLVDSATVVIENIFRFFAKKRKIDKEEEKIGLISKAVDEVGSGLLMSTITTILAFYPMAFVTGMMGPYMGPIPFFVPAALVASLVIAIVINPFIAYILSKNNRSKTKKKSRFLKLIDQIKNKYEKTMSGLLDNNKKANILLITVFFLFIVSMSLPFLKIVKFRLLPKMDMEKFFVYVDFPKNSSLERTNQFSTDLSDYIMENEKSVSSIQQFVGMPPVVDFNGLFKGSDSRMGENQATLKINLIDKKKRDLTSEELVLKLREEINNSDLVKKEPDVRLKFIEDPPGPPVVSTYYLKIQGEDYYEVKKITEQLEQVSVEIKSVVDVDNSIVEDNLKFIYRFDSEKANKLGVDSQNVFHTLRLMISGAQVGLFHEKNPDIRKPEPEYIVVRLKEEDRDHINDFDNVFVFNNQGEKVYINEIIDQTNDSEESIIFSDEKKKTAYVTAEMGDRSSTYASIDMITKLLDYKLPSGNGQIKDWSLSRVNYVDNETGKEYSVVLDGEWKLTLDVFRDLGIAMGVAVFLIYFVLVVQFKSLIEPLLIMGTIPLAMIGVMPGFALLGLVKGVYFNATSMIGVIALSGIVVNNAIILLEYINNLRKRDYELKKALIKAGKTRLLPILLTSVTTILGSLTIITDPVWEGLAWSIFWGLSLSSFLTLIIFPLLYYKFKLRNEEKTKN